MTNATKRPAKKKTMRLNVLDMVAHVMESLRESDDVFPVTYLTGTSQITAKTSSGQTFTITIEEK